MQVLKNVQLKSFNTLGLLATASEFTQISSKQDLVEALQYAKAQNLNVLTLSGGSNMLLPENIQALVIHMQIMGKNVVQQDDEYVWVEVGAGEIWHDFVVWTTAQKYYGLQNLALIPGLVGASPVQNIGAYGVEVGDFIDYVIVYDQVEEQFKQISAKQCNFSYRHSLFKESVNRYVITSVVFKLLKNAKLNINYGDLKAAVGSDETAENLQEQVIHIRKSKLPDPKEYPNVGSFFKNPIISNAVFETLKLEYPTIPNYPQKDGQVKIAAGWLIDQAGWKGKSKGCVGMFAKQALVLVNYGQASLDDVQLTYQAVQSDVLQKFGIHLEPEPVLFNAQGIIQAHR